MKGIKIMPLVITSSSDESEGEEVIITPITKKPDFSEYMWMEGEDDFDKKELQKLSDEYTIMQCIKSALEDDLEVELIKWRNSEALDNGSANVEVLISALYTLGKRDFNVFTSSLNPKAQEFIPRGPKY
ncbi:polyadenylate-binding protein-interacting protein 2-like [Teleopsis dalmanni]|uniref:polyadenylate-binding protein-interacting protein 2-like n=1 Tax=Teleopsis dalmanni TaxID=139649 RepID=UPI0018CFCE91|nr:polyadenylate-binding protein-interacting protein 2-like [Teleopsis dalmanni]